MVISSVTSSCYDRLSRKGSSRIRVDLPFSIGASKVPLKHVFYSHFWLYRVLSSDSISSGIPYHLQLFIVLWYFLFIVQLSAPYNKILFTNMLNIFSQPTYNFCLCSHFTYYSIPSISCRFFILSFLSNQTFCTDPSKAVSYSVFFFIYLNNYFTLFLIYVV